MEKKQNKFVLAIIVIAVLLNLVTVLMLPFREFPIILLFEAVAVVIEHVAVMYYVLFGYRKPHGNLLRYVMLLFALTLAIDLVGIHNEYSTFYVALSVAYVFLISYIAGRLNKIEQNRVLMSLVLILFIIDSVSSCIFDKPQTFIEGYRLFGTTIEWFTLSAAYFVRYREHKEAGLSDAPKAK